MTCLKRKFEIESGEFVTFSFEWDDQKSKTNKVNHHLNFEEVVQLFADQYKGTVQSNAKSKDSENREQIMVVDKNNKKWKLVFIVRETHTSDYPEHVIRIISCHRKD